jgi:uncharacterized protein (UPF0333 family)
MNQKNAKIIILALAFLLAVFIGIPYYKEGLSKKQKKKRQARRAARAATRAVPVYAKSSIMVGQDITSSTFKTRNPIKKCQDMCNTTVRKCVGFVVDTLNKKCYFKKSKVNDPRSNEVYGLWKQKK